MDRIKLACEASLLLCVRWARYVTHMTEMKYAGIYKTLVLESEGKRLVAIPASECDDNTETDIRPKKKTRYRIRWLTFVNCYIALRISRPIERLSNFLMLFSNFDIYIFQDSSSADLKL
jgi:hypothetical protein